jgi:probable F420-dependent oxidoreductase
MKLGVNILNFGRYATPENLLGWVRSAEQLGLEFAMISDHLAITRDVAEQYPAPFYDPFATLGWLVGQTSSLSLGTTVTVVPYRHPLHTARLVANIQRFSGAPFIFGVGVSWSRQEYDALGVDFTRRGAITDEYLEVIQMAWSEGVISYSGEHASFRDVATGPLPELRPLTWVGGSSALALRRAIRFGDAWHPLNLTAAQLEGGLKMLRELADRAEQPVPAVAPRLPLRITEEALDETRPLGQGTLAQIRDDLQWIAEIGATHVLLDTYRGAPDLARSPKADQADLEALLR